MALHHSRGRRTAHDLGTHLEPYRSTQNLETCKYDRCKCICQNRSVSSVLEPSNVAIRYTRSAHALQALRAAAAVAPGRFHPNLALGATVLETRVLLLTTPRRRMRPMLIPAYYE